MMDSSDGADLKCSSGRMMFDHRLLRWTQIFDLRCVVDAWGENYVCGWRMFDHRLRRWTQIFDLRCVVDAWRKNYVCGWRKFDHRLRRWTQIFDLRCVRRKYACGMFDRGVI